MIASSLLSESIIPLRTSDTGEEALTYMGDFYIKHLPIVNNHQLLGLLSEDDILQNDVQEAVGSYRLSLPQLFVQEDDHIYEIMRLVAEYKLTVIPVVNLKNEYQGMITQEDLIEYFARMASFTDPGSIIILELNRNNYSLSEIARIVESENANILSSYVSSQNLDKLIEVTIKVNKNQIGGILASFERFSYEVKASFNEAEYFDNIKERYNALMNYLNI